jgi:hypothetical protein
MTFRNILHGWQGKQVSSFGNLRRNRKAENPSIITNGLLVHLDAGDPQSYTGSGTTWTDLSGNGWNGTLTNGPTYSSANNGTIVLDGVNDYVTLGSTLAATASGTISFWIKFTNTITSGYAGNQRPWGKNDNFELRWGGNSLADIEFNRRLNLDLGQLLSLRGTQNNWYNTIWYNCVVTWNSSANRSSLYVQGLLDVTGTAANPSALTGTFNIGANYVPTAYVNGQMPHFMFYNRELTSSEVMQNFNAMRARYGV